MKHAPLVDLCALGGWKNAQTVLTCYQRADQGALVAALATRRVVGALAADGPIDTTIDTTTRVA